MHLAAVRQVEEDDVSGRGARVRVEFVQRLYASPRGASRPVEPRSSTPTAHQAETGVK
jgi:hypothetical protein